MSVKANPDGLCRQYFTDPLRQYAAEYGDLADNVYRAVCRGLDPEDPQREQILLIRSGNTEFTGYSNARPDDTQRIYVLKPVTVRSLPLGAELEYGGNCWLVTRTRSLGAPHGSALVRRCNALTHVRLKGKTVPVPLVLDTEQPGSTLSIRGSTDLLGTGRLHACARRCPATETWQENTRILLGRSDFIIRGMNDFTRERTFDDDSIGILTFTLEKTALLPMEAETDARLWAED